MDSSYLSACASNMADVVAYLAPYISSPSLGKACVLATTSTDIVRSTSLSPQQAREVLFATASGVGSSLNLAGKFRELVAMYGVEDIAGNIIGLAPVDIQVDVASIASRDTLLSLASRVNNREVARVYEDRGYIFPMNQAIELGALRSIEADITSDITSLLSSLFSSSSPPAEGVVSLLISRYTGDRERYLIVAARKNWGQACSEILQFPVHTHAAVIAAIRANAIEACYALSAYRTVAELRLAKSLGQTAAYNALLG